jgi:hypothetical protein
MRHCTCMKRSALGEQLLCKRYAILESLVASGQMSYLYSPNGGIKSSNSLKSQVPRECACLGSDGTVLSHCVIRYMYTQHPRA